MNEFLLIFRKDNSKEAQPSPSALQASIKPWQEWLGKLDAEGALVSHGNRLRPEGAVIKAGKIVTDGPYPDIKESIGGFVIIKAIDLAAATEIGKDCPVLDAPWNGFVEVRMLSKEV
ncbi:MAG: transcription initiation protein [Bacteroidetes bacterium]|uniref:YciI family protein n=1 Tax=Chitinophaga sp. LS1 TaxID=3051176 RepID=UPI001DD233C5|nr:YciI family protein [Chitinophaga sp. LS1]MBP1651022.1 transcription initiation protein [Bacteroidota bacterium]WPV63970.1 YciI family protein [Chitinophaga sp. LS1]